jgi:serine protease AprX
VSLALALAPLAAGSGTGAAPATDVQSSLLSAIQQNPKQTFDVILMGSPAGNSHGLLAKIQRDQAADGSSSSDSVGTTDVRAEYDSINGIHAQLTGRKLLRIIKRGLVSSIVANEPVQASAVTLPYTNTQRWPWVINAPIDWNTQATALNMPTIAIVDSGIDAKRADFGSRVLTQINFASLPPNSPGDPYGHGTFVASIAAGGAAGLAGVAPSAKLISLDVLNDQGQGTSADVVAACDWILQHKDAYNIRVVNLSLHTANRASVFFDPLDQAVEKLWLNGVTVVTASGNYAQNGQASGVPFAPANDPFVITVGAADIQNTIGMNDDVAAPWSAWGYTADGFLKPDLSAPGRYVIGATPNGATLMAQRPDRVVSNSPGGGAMQLSGTSFSAPMVAGAAAMLLAQHPSWTPDQVKGALMVSAAATPAAVPGSLGVGELNVAAARKVLNPPNPNAGLDQFVTTDSSGSRVFNSAAWQSAAQANAAWGSAAWSDAAWASAAWASAAWSDAAWSDAAWASAAWASAAWSDAAWSDAAWSDAAWSDAASGDMSIDPNATAVPYWRMAQIEASLGIVSPSCDPILSVCGPYASTP